MPDKVKFIDVRSQNHFDIVELARLAEVNEVVVYKMLIGEPVKRWQAEDVLKALSRLVGTPYGLDTVDVILYPETEKDE